MKRWQGGHRYVQSYYSLVALITDVCEPHFRRLRKLIQTYKKRYLFDLESSLFHIHCAHEIFARLVFDLLRITFNF